jgi:DNA-binding GntR family transcriptional regulator
VLAVREMAGNASEADLDRMREANRRFAEALNAGDLAVAMDADEDFHRVPVTVLGNDALVSVLDQFGPVVRRAERLRFAADGQSSLERHEQLIALLASGDGEGASDLTFNTWHTLSVDDNPSPEQS